MRFRLTPRWMTLDDLVVTAVTSNSLGNSRDFADLGANNSYTGKRMKIDPYCQRQRCNPLNAFSTLCCLRLGAFIQALLSLAYPSVS